MKKLEIVTGIGLIIILSMSYLHFRTNVAAQIISETEASALPRRAQVFLESLTAQPASTETFQTAYQKLIPGPQSQEIDVMVQKTEVMIKGGTRWQPELLDTKPVGTDLILIRYFHKCETHPVIWYFTFYRSQSGARWNCIDVRFDTDYNSLFKESWPK